MKPEFAKTLLDRFVERPIACELTDPETISTIEEMREYKWRPQLIETEPFDVNSIGGVVQLKETKQDDQ